jgi:hypothetical protein
MISDEDLEKGETSSSSLLNRNGSLVFSFAIISYILLQLIVTLTTQCTDNWHGNFVQFTQNYILGAGFIFSVSALQHFAKAIYCYKIDSTSSEKKLMLHIASVTISLIAGSSSLLTYVYNNGKCQFIIEGQASLWSQWIVCAPLLAYMVISGEDKELLSSADAGVIISIIVSVLCMLLIVFTSTNHEVDEILFIVSCLSVITSMILALIKVYKLRRNSEKDSFSKISVSSLVLVMNDSLFRLTWGILPFLPIILFSYQSNIINRDQLQIGYVLLTLLANWIFLNSIVDEQIHIAEKIRFREEAAILANATRQTFLR